MMMRLLLVLLAIVAVAFANGLARPPYNAPSVSSRSSNGYDDQYVECYDNWNLTGLFITVEETALPDLGTILFNNRIVSLLLNGIYLFYDDTNFNSDTLNGGVYAGWGDNVSVNLDDFAWKTSSVRMAGSPDGFQLDTLNFYEGEIYQGQQQYFDKDDDAISNENFGRSLIVTGCKPWTLYKHKNYQGRAVCFYPNDNCSPAFFGNATIMNGMSQKASSVRKGCFSDIKAFGEKYLTGSAVIGPLGNEQ